MKAASPCRSACLQEVKVHSVNFLSSDWLVKVEPIREFVSLSGPEKIHSLLHWPKASSCLINTHGLTIYREFIQPLHVSSGLRTVSWAAPPLSSAPLCFFLYSFVWLVKFSTDNQESPKGWRWSRGIQSTENLVWHFRRRSCSSYNIDLFALRILLFYSLIPI